MNVLEKFLICSGSVSEGREISRSDSEKTYSPSQRFSNPLPKSQGVLWIEAAVLIPVLLVITLGTAEIGHFYLQRAAIANIAQSVAMAIQQNPNITAEEMYEFQKSFRSASIPMREWVYGADKPYEVPEKCSVANCGVEGLDIRVQASTTPLQWETVRNKAPSDWSNPRIGKIEGENPWPGHSFKKNPKFPNSSAPFETDPGQDPSDDGQPYYIGVTVEWTARPLLTLWGALPIFSAGGVKQFAAAVVRPTSWAEGQGLRGVFGGYTPVMVGVKAINDLLAKGIHDSWGWGQNQFEKDVAWAKCRLPDDASVAQFIQLYEDEQCSGHFCSGAFSRGMGTGGNPVGVKLTLSCDKASPSHTWCGKKYPGQWALQFGCTWIDGVSQPY